MHPYHRRLRRVRSVRTSNASTARLHHPTVAGRPLEVGQHPPQAAEKMLRRPTSFRNSQGHETSSVLGGRRPVAPRAARRSRAKDARMPKKTVDAAVSRVELIRLRGAWKSSSMKELCQAAGCYCCAPTTRTAPPAKCGPRSKHGGASARQRRVDYGASRKFGRRCPSTGTNYLAGRGRGGRRSSTRRSADPALSVHPLRADAAGFVVARRPDADPEDALTRLPLMRAPRSTADA